MGATGTLKLKVFHSPSETVHLASLASGSAGPLLTEPGAEVHVRCLKLSFLEPQNPFLSAVHNLGSTSECT